MIEIAKTDVTSDAGSEADPERKKYFQNSLNKKYLENTESMFLGHQPKKESKFHIATRVEAELIKGSDHWELGKIRSHDNYFSSYVVYFENGKKATLPPERIRHLGQQTVDEGATDELKEREFYKMLGCDDIEKVRFLEEFGGTTIYLKQQNTSIVNCTKMIWYYESRKAYFIKKFIEYNPD